MSTVTAGPAAGGELEKDTVGEEKLCYQEVPAHNLRPPPPAGRMLELHTQGEMDAYQPYPRAHDTNV